MPTPLLSYTTPRSLAFWILLASMKQHESSFSGHAYSHFSIFLFSTERNICMWSSNQLPEVLLFLETIERCSYYLPLFHIFPNPLSLLCFSGLPPPVFHKPACTVYIFVYVPSFSLTLFSLFVFGVIQLTGRPLSKVLPGPNKGSRSWFVSVLQRRYLS